MSQRLKLGIEDKLLKAIYDRYISVHGRGVRNLKDFPILITAHEVYAQHVPELVDEQGEVTRYQFVPAMKELEASGYIRFDGRSSYHLTEQGYRQAGMSWIDRMLEFFNRNQGLAVPISILSLAVSFIALFVSS